MNVCSYHLQEAGATPVQELAFALATAIAVLDTVKASGEVKQEDFGEVVGRISFFVNAGLRFITEMCKMRAFAELWDEITRERYGVTDAKQRLFRYGVQVNSLGLTEQQPENNVYRILIEMLAVTLSKNARARAVQLAGLERGARPAAPVRPAMVAAHAADPRLRDRPARIRRHLRRLEGDRRARSTNSSARRATSSTHIDEAGRRGRGGRDGLHERRSSSRAIRSALEAIERGEQIVVGVNKFIESEPSPLSTGEGSILTVPHGGRGRADRAPQGLARGARRQGGRRRACSDLREAAAVGPQHHAGLDRCRQGRRHHRRMGR